jgi:predicted phage tail protein
MSEERIQTDPMPTKPPPDSQTDSPASSPADAPQSSLAQLSGDAGCVLVIVVVAIAIAASTIFSSAVVGHAAWAGAFAVAALSAMGVGIVYALTRKGR